MKTIAPRSDVGNKNIFYIHNFTNKKFEINDIDGYEQFMHDIIRNEIRDNFVNEYDIYFEDYSISLTILYEYKDDFKILECDEYDERPVTMEFKMLHSSEFEYDVFEIIKTNGSFKITRFGTIENCIKEIDNKDFENNLNHFLELIKYVPKSQ